jgi:Zn-dependent peptidase ImmA (M78 family)
MIGIDRIIEKASSIYSQYGSDNLDLVAEKLGASVYGLLEAEHLKEAYFPERKAIAIKPGLPSYERRYLIAHALGHHLFHRDETSRDYLRLHLKHSDARSTQDSAEIARLEDEADLFAAFLLVPDSKLRPRLEEGSIWRSEDPVLHLAMEFQVPVEPMRVRLAYERSNQLKDQE